MCDKIPGDATANEAIHWLAIHQPERLRRRFLGKIRKDPESGHWYWTGAISKIDGYGYLSQRVGPRSIGRVVKMRAHCISFVLHKGPIPADKPFVCHNCHERTCARPDHVHAGTHEENMQEMVDAGRSLYGIKNHRAKMTPSKIEKAKKMRADGRTLKAIGDKFGVHLDTIRRALSGQTWSKI